MNKSQFIGFSLMEAGDIRRIGRDDVLRQVQEYKLSQSDDFFNALKKRKKSFLLFFFVFVCIMFLTASIYLMFAEVSELTEILQGFGILTGDPDLDGFFVRACIFVLTVFFLTVWFLVVTISCRRNNLIITPDGALRDVSMGSLKLPSNALKNINNDVINSVEISQEQYEKVVFACKNIPELQKKCREIIAARGRISTFDYAQLWVEGLALILVLEQDEKSSDQKPEVVDYKSMI